MLIKEIPPDKLFNRFDLKPDVAKCLTDIFQFKKGKGLFVFYYPADRLLFCSASIILSSLPVCPAMEVFSCARRIR